MSMFKRITLAALTAAIFAIVTAEPSAVTAPEPHPGLLQASADATWQSVLNGPGRFSVMVPGSLSADSPVTDPNGIVSHTFVASQAGKAYVVVYTDASVSNPQLEMDAARDAFLKGISASLVAEHRFKSVQPVGEVMATEFTCRSASEGTECKARSYYYSARLYMIGVLHRIGSGSALDTDRFLDSFRITS
jgi:hypothetical protein